MRNRLLGICGALLGAASFIASLGTASSAAAAEPKPAAGAELSGWSEPGPADLAVLESLEGDNLAEARKVKGKPLQIQATKKDLDGDGIPELFFFVNHPLFCYEELGGCALLVVRRVSLSDPWQEVGAMTAPAPNVVVMPAKGGDMPTLRPLGSQPYTWDGHVYRTEPGDAPVVPASDAEMH